MPRYPNTVEMLGHYGGDRTHALSAWTSTSRDLTPEKEARIPALLTMLAKEGHHTPFEKSTLHFLVCTETATHIHLLKHRVGVSCLSGDTVVEFLNSNMEACASKRYTMRELWSKWTTGRPHQPTEADMAYQRRRLQAMNIRVVDDTCLEFTSSNMVRVIHQGTKITNRYILENSSAVCCTPDHKVLTQSGWLPIERAYAQGIPIAHKSHVGRRTEEHAPLVDEASEEWMWVPGHEGKYEVSNQGRVRSYYNNRYLMSEPQKIKNPTYNPQGYAVVNLSRKTHLVSRLVLMAFCSEPEDGWEARHLNHNTKDNRITNLAWGNSRQNSEDSMVDDRHARLRVKFIPIIAREEQGPQEVFDLEIAGSHHNFVVNDGIVVHNCNAESARYKEIKEDRYYIPDDWPLAAQENVEAVTQGAMTSYHAHMDALEYEVGRKRAKETARFLRPYNQQIKADISFNFRSFYHFLTLRYSTHAQVEVRDLARQMLEMVAGLDDFKYTLQAFDLIINGNIRGPYTYSPWTTFLAE